MDVSGYKEIAHIYTPICLCTTLFPACLPHVVLRPRRFHRGQQPFRLRTLSNRPAHRAAVDGRAAAAAPCGGVGSRAAQPDAAARGSGTGQHCPHHTGGSSMLGDDNFKFFWNRLFLPIIQDVWKSTIEPCFFWG